MDTLSRMRVFLWLLVFCLWGLMIHQFLADSRVAVPRMLWLSRALPDRASQRPISSKDRIERAKRVFPAKPAHFDHAPVRAVANNPTNALAVVPAPPSALPALPPAAPKFPSGEKPPKPAPPKTVAPRPIPAPDSIPEEETETAPEPPEAPAPKGFVKTKTRHFVVYAEDWEAEPEFLKTLESLHANLMIDLAAFSPWARDQRVSIFLFRSQDSYREVTGRPAWSGGASSIKRRKIYLYESEEIVGILAHELCHIYFDSFFIGGENNPLWLSEGMATLVQTERGLSAPNWLKENLEALRKGKGFDIDDLVGLENTGGAADGEVRLWYTQSYSVVRFLIRSQYRSSFYRFCRQLREGKPLEEALYLAYGMPFNRIKALEFAWRHDLQTKK